MSSVEPTEYIALRSTGRKALVIEGSGPHLIVVHGGPGMDSSYLQEDLRGLAQVRSVTFYNQYPTRNDKPDASDVNAVTELNELIEISQILADKSGDRVGLLAHSWGTYLAIEALHIRQDLFTDVVLINPLPLTWERLAAAGDRLMARVAQHDLDHVVELEGEGTEESGQEVMRIVAYAYLAPGSTTRDTGVRRYNPIVNSTISASIENYDQTTHVDGFDIKGLAIYGEYDYIEQDDSRELARKFDTVTLEEVGHFPFVEAPRDLERVLIQFLS